MVLLGVYMLAEGMYAYFGVLFAWARVAQFVGSLLLNPILKRVKHRNVVKGGLAVALCANILIAVAIEMGSFPLLIVVWCLETLVGSTLSTTVSIMLVAQLGNKHIQGMARIGALTTWVTSALVVCAPLLPIFGWAVLSASATLTALSMSWFVAPEGDKPMQRGFKGFFRDPAWSIRFGMFPVAIAEATFISLLPTAGLITHSALWLGLVPLATSVIGIRLSDWVAKRRHKSAGLILWLRLAMTMGLAIMLVSSLRFSGLISLIGIGIGTGIWCMGLCSRGIAQRVTIEQTRDRVTNATIRGIEFNLAGVLAGVYISGVATPATPAIQTTAMAWTIILLAIGMIVPLLFWKQHKLSEEQKTETKEPQNRKNHKKWWFLRGLSLLLILYAVYRRWRHQ